MKTYLLRLFNYYLVLQQLWKNNNIIAVYLFISFINALFVFQKKLFVWVVLLVLFCSHNKKLDTQYTTSNLY